MDNIFIERLWRSRKYEEVYIHAYASIAEAKAGIGAWLCFYNDERQHQSHGAHAAELSRAIPGLARDVNRVTGALIVLSLDRPGTRPE
jgi:transposase InsO family protein